MLKGKRQLNFLNLFVVGLALLLVFAPSSVAFAKPMADPNLGIYDKTLELTLDYQEESDKTLAIEGATLEIYKIADLDKKNGFFEYTVESPFKEKGITSDFKDLTAAQTRTLTKEFEKVIKEKKIPNQGINTTDSEGKVLFKDLDPGIYLVKQVGRKGQARKFNNIVPFLVIVPSFQLDQYGNLLWEYDVKAKPKINPKTDPPNEPPAVPPETPPNPPETPPCPPETPAPKTGDDSHLFLYGGVGLMAMALLISNYYRLKKVKQEEN